LFARFHAFRSNRTPSLALAVLLALVVSAAPRAEAADDSAPPSSSPAPSAEALGVDGPAALAPLAAQSLLLDIAAAGPRLVAVGERGHILLSDDQGLTWRQAPTPTRATLTAVFFADPQHGWAVGHLGTILRTVDSGESWQRLSAGLDRESVLLDVRFLDTNDGFAVGAYGLFLRTRDGGATWTRSEPQTEQYHFNHISRTQDGALFLVGEAGTLLRSRDGALNWESVPPPYEGSLFGLVSLADGQLLVHGLRGHVFRSNNGGAGWQPVPTPVATLLMHGLRLRNGLVVLAGQSGNFLVSRDQGQSFDLWRPGGSLGVSALLETADGALIAVGEKGVRRLDPPPRRVPTATP
jgi:photosystem II stability/assembly factor-like uncharacterized protein